MKTTKMQFTTTFDEVPHRMINDFGGRAKIVVMIGSDTAGVYIDGEFKEARQCPQPADLMALQQQVQEIVNKLPPVPGI